MLHFLAKKPNVMYIGVCDWGEVECWQEVMPSLYGFAKEQYATNAKKMCWWVALELFFVYNESRTSHSLRRMVKQHTTTLRFEAYLMGRLANIIWGDDWDVEYFVDNSTKMSLGN